MLRTIFIFNKSKRQQIPVVKDNDQRYQLVRWYDVSKKSVSLRHQLKLLCSVLSWLVSLRYLVTSLGRHKLVDFIYVPVTRRKIVSGRSVLFMYQLRCRDDVLAQSRIFKLVTKIGNFFRVLGSTCFRRLRWFSLIKVPASTFLKRLKIVGLIQVLVVTSLGRVKLVSLTQVSIGKSLRRPKLVSFERLGENTEKKSKSKQQGDYIQNKIY